MFKEVQGCFPFLNQFNNDESDNKGRRTIGFPFSPLTDAASASSSSTCLDGEADKPIRRAVSLNYIYDKQRQRNVLDFHNGNDAKPQGKWPADWLPER